MEGFFVRHSAELTTLERAKIRNCPNEQFLQLWVKSLLNKHPLRFSFSRRICRAGRFHRLLAGFRQNGVGALAPAAPAGAASRWD